MTSLALEISRFKKELDKAIESKGELVEKFRDVNPELLAVFIEECDAIIAICQSKYNDLLEKQRKEESALEEMPKRYRDLPGDSEKVKEKKRKLRKAFKRKKRDYFIEKQGNEVIGKWKQYQSDRKKQSGFLSSYQTKKYHQPESSD